MIWRAQITGSTLLHTSLLTYSRDKAHPVHFNTQDHCITSRQGEVKKIKKPWRLLLYYYVDNTASSATTLPSSKVSEEDGGNILFLFLFHHHLHFLIVILQHCQNLHHLKSLQYNRSTLPPPQQYPVMNHKYYKCIFNLIRYYVPRVDRCCL